MLRFLFVGFRLRNFASLCAPITNLHSKAKSTNMLHPCARWTLMALIVKYYFSIEI